MAQHQHRFTSQMTHVAADSAIRRRHRARFRLTPGAALAGLALMVAGAASAEEGRMAALYPHDGRRDLTGADITRYPGAGVLFCHRRPDGIPQKAAAAWLVGSPRLVVMNAHNFRNRRMEVTREVEDCFFQIGGRNYGFVPASLRLGAAPDAKALHITDDWALLDLTEAVVGAPPQPVPDAPILATGIAEIPVVMVSPGGHENYRGPSSTETCAIHQIDPPTEDDIRRARHNCNDGFGGSGSGLFDLSGRLVAMQSASLSMNSRRPFDLEFHYGSALLFEGALLAAIRQAVTAEGEAAKSR